MAWTLHVRELSQPDDPARREPAAPLTCRTYADLLLQLRVECQASPDAVVEVVIPASADPDDIRALRRRGYVLHYRRNLPDRGKVERRIAAG
ncbi:hypothetical protein [Lichenicoccus roseus]|uniref:Uncharacterized protein n=1 Tax=Lichenicoccus roseus TaxID=2683649 RepID=A0A5R9J281_9PROT|nr:hypothetical protein [Lichenicoccus roseus]TLU71734.1 hypothetical protein FE263_14800 [Lichenicoccus roseus]